VTSRMDRRRLKAHVLAPWQTGLSVAVDPTVPALPAATGIDSHVKHLPHLARPPPDPSENVFERVGCPAVRLTLIRASNAGRASRRMSRRTERFIVRARKNWPCAIWFRSLMSSSQLSLNVASPDPLRTPAIEWPVLRAKNIFRSGTRGGKTSPLRRMNRSVSSNNRSRAKARNTVVTRRPSTPFAVSWPAISRSRSASRDGHCSTPGRAQHFGFTGARPVTGPDRVRHERQSQ
jgi:hypothetical protein